MEFHELPRMPRGFTCASTSCGLKKEGDDLALFYSAVSANAAGVFTQNKFPGAPVILGRETIKRGRLSALVVNSKISNVGTGQIGVENARRMARAAARECGVPENEVMVSSTGVIAKQLPIEQIENAIVGLFQAMQPDPLVGARGIMTTDTHPKALSLSVGEAVLTLVAKGSGMIEPNLATMLVYAFTDAQLSTSGLDAMLRRAVDKSFNMLSVDTDTSTSDTCVILANGLAGKVDETQFYAALEMSCIEMAKRLARDGEGATKLILANIMGASTVAEAKIFAKAIINSPLIKTMAYGADPNIGRILMAIGKCTECDSLPEKIEIRINGVLVYANLNKTDFDEMLLRRLLSGEEVAIDVHLHLGAGCATAFGCDLTEGYIKENAAYYSS